MSANIETSEQLVDFAEHVRAAEQASAKLLSSIMDKTCRRLSLPSQKANSDRLHDLIREGAFIQAAIAMVEFELPQWRIRRLAYDEGAWHCALSSQRELPDWLDQAVETCHADMSLAIAAAYLEVLRQLDAKALTHRNFVPRISKPDLYTVCCENLR